MDAMSNGMLYIIRGLPGSGKSTLANELGGLVCEADQYFYDDKGVYRFDASKLSEAHAFCQNKVEEAMKGGYNVICVSNTFTRRWEFDPYIGFANQYDYDVTEITLSGTLHGNIHNVPEETIKVMTERWER